MFVPTLLLPFGHADPSLAGPDPARAPLTHIPPVPARTPPTEVALWVLCGLLLVVFAVMDLPLEGQAVLAAATVAVGLWIAARAPEVRHALAFLSVAVSARYLYWRVTQTLEMPGWADGFAGVALLSAELYGFAVMGLGYQQTLVMRPRRPVPLPPDPSTWPHVDVFIPTYNEDVDLVERTLIGALAMNYPRHEVHLLDDGRRPAMQALAQKLGVTYHIRGDNKHAKAGNINAALARTRARPAGALVAIFDCDHVPVRSFLRVTAGAFVADPRLALVQTPHYFYNPDPFERNLSLSAATPSENAIFYHAVQIGNDFWNSVLFCGSCALIRRTALEEVGGIAVETVTEDAHTSLRMLARGWRSMYLDVPQAAGLATERYGIHVAQRIRWARGMTQILLLDSPLTKPGLSWPQRTAYLNAILHFQLGLFRIIFVLAPLSYLLLGLRPLSADPVEMLVFAVPHMALAVAGGEVTSRGMRHAFWSEVYEAALAPYTMLVTAMAWVNPRHGTFNVTTKGATLDTVRFDWRGAAPNLVLLGLCVVGLLAAPVRALAVPEEMGAILLTTFFCGYNTLVMAAAVAVALDRPQQRRAHRVARSYPVQVSDPATGALLRLGQSRDLTDAGVGVVLHGGAADDLPRAVRVSLQVDGVWSPPMDARIASRGTEGGKVTLGIALTPEAAEAHRRTLVEAMFSAPDSWRVDAQPVRASVALLNLLRSPVRAAWSLRAGRGAR